MAKRKNSVALFEVITATRRKQEAAAAAAASIREPAALKTPKWWFKRSKGRPALGNTAAQQATLALPQTTFAPETIAAAEISPPIASAQPQLEAPVAFEEPAPFVISAPAIVQRVMPAPPPPERVMMPATTVGPVSEGDPFGLEIPSQKPVGPQQSWIGRFTARKVRVNPDRREVTVRFRYTTAIVAGFAVCVLIGLAYITGGRKANHATARAGGASSEQIKRGPILAGVLDIRPSGGGTKHDDSTDDADDSGFAQPASSEKHGNIPNTPAPHKEDAGAHVTAGGVEFGLPRTIGLNYVIIQSYPEEKMANDAQKALEAADIPCSVQPTPTDWRPTPGWYSVIGTFGFPRTETMPAYRDYIRKLDAVNKSFAAKSKMKAFNPSPYKWNASSLR